MSARPVLQADVLAQILEGVQALRAEVAELREVLARRPTPDTSAADAEFVQAIFATLKDRTFASWELGDYVADRSLQFARLRAAVEASIGSADSRRIGKALRRLQGLALGGLVVEREGENREGALWRVRECGN